MVTGRTSLTRAGVLADLVLGEVGAAQQLVLPLPGGDGVGHQDQCRGLGRRHRRGADDRLARPAGEDDHAGAAVPERLGGLPLVVAQGPTVLAQPDLVRLAVDVAGEVLGRPAELEQGLLEVAALRAVHRDRVVVDALTEHAGDLLGAQHLLEHGAVGGDQDQSVHRMLLQPQPAEAGHRLGDVDQEGVRHGVAAVGQQRVDHLLGVMAGRPGVPEAEVGQPVGVDVLRAALQLGERRDRLAAVLCARVVDLQQQGLVALHDQGAVAHPVSLRRCPDGRGAAQPAWTARTPVIRCTA